MKKLVALLLALVMLLSASIALAEANPAVYSVEDQNGNKIYLFGTMHMVEPHIFENEMPLGPALEEAYNYAEILAVEVDALALAEDPNAQMQQMMQMVYSDGTTALDHGVSEELLEKAAAMIGLPEEQLAAFKAKNWASLLLIPAMAAVGLDANSSADGYLLTRAHNDQKDVDELETSQEQDKALASMSDELSLAMVEQSVANPEAVSEGMRLMYTAWKTGDVENLKKYLAEDGTEGLSEEMLKDLQTFNASLNATRDKGFFEDAVDYLANGEKVLIAIGAAHIVGETGLVNTLTQAGYTVTRIDAE